MPPALPLLRAGTLALACLLPGLAAAQESLPSDAGTGDAGAGEAIFDRQCASCHVVQDKAGEVLAGRRARTGPNLHGVIGRTPGTYPDFNYSASMRAYGETGAAWGEADLVPYVQDPTGFLRDALRDPRARGRMAFQLRREEDARDVLAFLATMSPGSRPE